MGFTPVNYNGVEHTAKQDSRGNWIYSRKPPKVRFTCSKCGSERPSKWGGSNSKGWKKIVEDCPCEKPEDLEEEDPCECITTDMSGKCTHCLSTPEDRAKEVPLENDLIKWL